jgi:hypothetical protein
MKGENLMESPNMYPRSVREKYLGVVQLARTIDKAKMLATGTIGEYKYDCPMDQALFTKFGIDGKRLAHLVSEVAKNPARNADMDAYLNSLVGKKSHLEIENFNREVLTNKPVGDSLKHFEQLRAQIAPSRADVTSWPDLLDLEEGRQVPERMPVSI